MRFALVTEDPILTRDLAGCLAGDSIAVESFDGELPLVRAMRASTYDLVLIDAKNGSLLLDSLLSWRHCNAAACTPAIV
ncbi:MAG: hypothetical protein ACN6PY_02490, partial [Paraburkholderia nemoris]